MSDDKGQDDKILCVPREDPNWNGLRVALQIIEESRVRRRETRS